MEESCPDRVGSGLINVSGHGRIFGLSLVINLLATPLKSWLPVFISPFPDLAAFGIDALSVLRDSFGMVYAFPSMALVCYVLLKLWGLDLVVIMLAPW